MFFPATNAQSQSEDCLTLNVFTATEGQAEGSSAMRPVIVYVYGGSNHFGSTEAYLLREIMCHKIDPKAV